MKKSRWGIAGRMLLLCTLAGAAWSPAFAADGTTTGAPTKETPTNVVDIKPATSAPTNNVGLNPQTIPLESVVRKSRTIAAQLARDVWIHDKIADANPRLGGGGLLPPRVRLQFWRHTSTWDLRDRSKPTRLLCRRFDALEHRLLKCCLLRR